MAVFFHFSQFKSWLSQPEWILYQPRNIFNVKRNSSLVIVKKKKNHNSAYLSLIPVYFVLTVTSSVLWTEGRAHGTAASQVVIVCVNLLL